MKSPWNYAKSYLTFSKRERNGITVLVLVLVLIIIAIKMVPKTSSSPNPAKFIALQREVDSLFIDEKPKSVKNPLTSSNRKPGRKFQKNITIEINTSDSSTLTQLPGIGPVFASRIIKYRNLLGGFYHVNQLKEVYGLKEENFAKAYEHITVKTSLVQGISVDTSGFKCLARHPYIGRERAWQIINFRNKSYTGIISFDDMKNSHIFDSLHWQRVMPYLIFQKNSEVE